MSYCRWSCDGFRSDVYAYESVDGDYVIHLANTRLDGAAIPDLMPGFLRGEVSSAEYGAYMDAIAEAPRVNIEHPAAGATFKEKTRKAFRDRLIWLREEGFHVPQDAIDEIEEELRVVKGQDNAD